MYCDACMTHMFDIVPSRCTHNIACLPFFSLEEKGKAKKKEISSKACPFMHRHWHFMFDYDNNILTTCGSDYMIIV